MDAAPFYVTDYMTKKYSLGLALSVNGDEKPLAEAIAYLAANWRTNLDSCALDKTGNR